MEYVNSALITLGMIFISLGLINYLKLLKDFKNIYKPIQLPHKKKKNIIIFATMVSFIFIYISHFSYIFLKKEMNN